jgi:hypothetical protein
MLVLSMLNIERTNLYSLQCSARRIQAGILFMVGRAYNYALNNNLV